MEEMSNMSDLKLISNNDSNQKYALQVTIKGREYLFTKIKNNLALIPVSGNTVKDGGKFLAWDTQELAKKFLDEIKSKYPEEFIKIWKMKPKIIPVNPIQWWKEI